MVFSFFFLSINEYWTPTRLAMLQIPSVRAYVVRLYIYYAYIFFRRRYNNVIIYPVYDLQDDDDYYYYYYHYNNMFYIIRNRTLERRRRQTPDRVRSVCAAAVGDMISYLNFFLINVFTHNLAPVYPAPPAPMTVRAALTLLGCNNCPYISRHHGGTRCTYITYIIWRCPYLVNCYNAPCIYKTIYRKCR